MLSKRFRVEIAKPAFRDYQKLSVAEQRKVQRRLKLLETEPLAGKKLKGGLEGRFSLRAWPYRIIYQINQPAKTVYISAILHRQEAY